MHERKANKKNNKTETQKTGRIVMSFKKGNDKPLQLSVSIPLSPLNQS